MAIIQPSRTFENSDIGPEFQLNHLIGQKIWTTKKDRAHSAKLLLGYSARNNIPLKVAMPLIKAAVEGAGGKYHPNFYRNAYMVALQNADQEGRQV